MIRLGLCAVAAAGLSATGAIGGGGAAGFHLELPTANRALLDGHPEAFFMGVNRKERDAAPRLVWEGGQFGFVRAPMTWEGTVIFTQFHEGIDIAPVERDEAGEPRDVAHSIGSGVVVNCHSTPVGSAYGIHLIIRHDWGCGPIYSLYAHLQRVEVREGETVKTGTPLGVLGHTGTGIELSRAHLHLEINLMLDEAFDPRQWRSETRTPGAGALDRLNMAGIDPAGLFEALKRDPAMTLPRFVTSAKPYFIVAVPRHGQIDLLRRYPWLLPQEPLAERASWEISFTAWGLPVKFSSSSRAVVAPEVTWVEPFSGKHTWRTGGLLSGSGPTAILSAQGLARVGLVLGERGK